MMLFRLFWAGEYKKFILKKLFQIENRSLDLFIYFFFCRSIQNYGKKYQSNDSQFETYAFFRAFGDFIEIFSFSLIIGAVMGCITALISFYFHSSSFSNKNFFFFQIFLFLTVENTWPNILGLEIFHCWNLLCLFWCPTVRFSLPKLAI